VEDKDCEWAEAAMGMVGLETALGVVAAAMVETGLLDWAGVAERMSVAPARIGRLAGQGRPIAVGEPANLVLVDPARERVVEASALHSRSRNTPYAGVTLPATVVATFLRGRPTLLDGVVRSAAVEEVPA
jgi:dihydroorotase